MNKTLLYIPAPLWEKSPVNKDILWVRDIENTSKCSLIYFMQSEPPTYYNSICDNFPYKGRDKYDPLLHEARPC